MNIYLKNLLLGIGLIPWIDVVNNLPWPVLVKKSTCKVSHYDIVEIEKEGDDDSEAPLKEGVDIRIAEKRQIKGYGQATPLKKK